MLLLLPVQAFATSVKSFDCSWLLDCSSLKLLISWFSMSEKSNYSQVAVLNPLIFVVQRSPWSLDPLIPWSLDWLSKRALIAWFNFDPGCKRFWNGCVNDYPLDQRTSINEIKTNSANYQILRRHRILASFPGPAQLSVTCSQRKAGRGLGRRLMGY